jgi:hypothetical protein
MNSHKRDRPIRQIQTQPSIRFYTYAIHRADKIGNKRISNAMEKQTYQPELPKPANTRVHKDFAPGDWHGMTEIHH